MIKIEPPGEGDALRKWRPDLRHAPAPRARMLQRIVGEHTEEVLRDDGYSVAEIARLKEGRIL